MAASPQYGNMFLPADTNTIAGPVRIAAAIFVGGASGGVVTIKVDSDTVFSETFAANERFVATVPFALDSGENLVFTLTGTAQAMLFEA